MQASTTTPAPPKRPMNAVFQYKNEKYPAYKEKNPTSKITDATRELCAEYDKLTDA